MAGLFGKPEWVKCCECAPGPECRPCPDGTIYPWLVTISIPSLGVSVLAGNELDEDGDGETDFLYRWEGVEDGYDSQSFFGPCEYAVAIQEEGPEGENICSGSAAAGEGSMQAVSCYPDPLILIYTIRCSNGSTLEVIIAE